MAPGPADGRDMQRPGSRPKGWIVETLCIDSRGVYESIEVKSPGICFEVWVATTDCVTPPAYVADFVMILHPCRYFIFLRRIRKPDGIVEVIDNFLSK